MSTNSTSSIKHIVFWGFVVFSLVAIVNLSRGLLDLIQAAERVDEAEEQLKILEEEQARLEGELEWKSSNAFVEQEIRNQLKMARPDETVVVLGEEHVVYSPESERQDGGEESMANWRKWLALFTQE